MLNVGSWKPFECTSGLKTCFNSFWLFVVSGFKIIENGLWPEFGFGNLLNYFRLMVFESEIGFVFHIDYS